MKNVLLIGDSVRMGYDKAVKKSLEGIVNVYFPEENCRFAAYVLRYIHEYKDLLAGSQVDVIHWNAGLWDCLRLFGEEVQTPIDIYAYYIERICIRIKKMFPEAQVIFATSTSVCSESMLPDFKRYNEDIEKYNAAAIKVVSKYGCRVNDLYLASIELPEGAHSDSVHYYTSLATKKFTEQVLYHICSALSINQKIEYKEELYTNNPIGI